jgi:polysaccharide export outer membrane protein
MDFLFRLFWVLSKRISGRDGLRDLVLVAMFASLSACAFAPGMRMREPVQSPTTSGSDKTPVSEVDFSIADINASLIEQLRDADAKANDGETANLLSRPSPYTLGVGDVLQITVWDHPELAAAQAPQSQPNTRAADPVQGFLVDQNGDLQFPYIDRLRVVGLRPEEVQERLAVLLRKAFRDPQVTVRIASFRAKQIYVDGEVRTPGVESINDIPMTLYEAVNRAGGFTDSADQGRMVLVRAGVSYSLNLTRIIEEGKNPANITLQNGDLLRVRSREDTGVFVMGEVNRPIKATPMRNGTLTLSEAISQAGSLNMNTADGAQLYVIRDSRSMNPKVFRLDARSPVSMVLANQFELQPNDVVYIDGNGLVRFSRVLSLLLPGINASLTAGLVTK